MQHEGVHTGWPIEDLSMAAPHYVEEVEALLGIPFFADEERSQALYNNDLSMIPLADIALRSSAYIQGLRIFARTRAQERRSADLEPKEVATWNSNWLSTLTVKRVCAIAEQHRQVAIEAAYDIETVEESDPETDTLYPLQEEYVDDTLAALSLPARRVAAVEGDYDHTFRVHGVNVIGPTGIGKTAVMGAIAARLGIGKPHERSPEREKRMLIVVPSDQLVRQIAGTVGDRTFTRFAEGLVPTTFHGPLKDLAGSVIVTTTRQYVEGFRAEQFFGIPIDIMVFDEAHHLTEPLVEKTFLHEWHGPTIGFTATPDYNEYKDVRSILPYIVEHLDLMESIDQGITNGAQLFSILVECSDEELASLTPKEARQYLDGLRLMAQRDFLAPLMAEGRRAMVFCREGKSAEQAKLMAAALSEIELPSGRHVTAETINTYNPSQGRSSNSRIVERFHAGEVDALTTVRTGLESFNADIDVVVIGDVYSFLKLRQLIGRGTRLSERFPVTIYAQFMVRRLRSIGKVPLSIYQAFGLEHIEQGMVFRGQAEPSSGEKAADLSIFPPHLQQHMQQINHKKISDVLLIKTPGYTPFDEMPEGYIPFHEIPIPSGMTASSAKYRLDTAGLTWEGTFIPGRPGMVRYYEPAAKTFFIDNRTPGRASPDLHISIGALAKHYNVAHGTMQSIVEEECRIPTIELQGRTKKGQYIRRAKIAQLDAHMEKERPLRQSHDISAEKLAAEIGVKYSFLRSLGDRHGIRLKYRREPPPSGQGNPRRSEQSDESPYKYSKAEADQLRDIINSYPRANDTDQVKGHVMEKVGMTDMKRFSKSLTDEEKAWLAPRWIRDKRDRLRLFDTWTHEQTARIIQRFKEELTHELPIHLLPSIAAAQLFGVGASFLSNKMRVGLHYKDHLQRMQLGIATTTTYICLPWHLVQQLQAEWHARPPILKIDYTNLPASPDDNNPDRIAYARLVQTKLTPDSMLGFDPRPYMQSKR